jgi:hypothetical protein
MGRSAAVKQLTAERSVHPRMAKNHQPGPCVIRAVITRLWSEPKTNQPYVQIGNAPLERANMEDANNDTDNLYLSIILTPMTSF